MSVDIRQEPSDLKHCEAENCVFCRSKTRWWANPHVPCCTGCAQKVNQKDVDKHTPFRLLLESFIISRYKKSKLDEVSIQGISLWIWENEIAVGNGEDPMREILRYESLQYGKITIEEYLHELNDFELIQAFRSQCCEEFR